MLGLELWSGFVVTLKLTTIMVTILAFIKFNSFLRIFDGFCFLVSMIQSVFIELKFFLSFFVFVLIEFGLLFFILIDDTLEDYVGIDAVSYYMFSFRASLGDFDVAPIKDSSLVAISWVIWIIAVFVMNLIFMNFIIAVISESYEKVMQKLIA
jgi:hypothetical protein